MIVSTNALERLVTKLKEKRYLRQQKNIPGNFLGK